MTRGEYDAARKKLRSSVKATDGDDDKDEALEPLEEVVPVDPALRIGTR